MTDADFQSLTADIASFLEADNGIDALHALAAALGWPGDLDSNSQWASALELLARIADQLGPPALAERARTAQAQLDDPDRLYDLGWELVDVGLNDMAATVLARANDRRFGEPQILSELVCALEREQLHSEACRVLREAPEVIQNDFLCRYLLGFNSAMAGDMDATEELLPGLQALVGTEDDRRPFLYSTLEGFVARAHAIRGATPLDATDLRGWHVVLNGALLLHLSPYGFEEGMRGRYAFVQDSAASCVDGIRRLEAVLRARGKMPTRVLFPADRDSEILALATGALLSLPVEPHSPGAEGLIAVYDLSDIVRRGAKEEAARDLVESLADHHPRQILWSHGCAWTSDVRVAPDVVTFLHQMNISPWGPRLGVDPETKKTIQHPEDLREPKAIAAEIAATSLEGDALEDLPVLLALSEAMTSLEGPHAAGFLRDAGRRRRQWMEGPVRSNRFA